MELAVVEKLADKKITKQELYNTVTSDFNLLPTLLNGVSSPKAAVRYGCSSVLLELSAKYPEKLDPYIDTFTALLNSSYRILKWNATTILANLTSVDSQKKFDAQFDKYFGLLNDGYLVTAANVVSNAWKIAVAKPYLANQIAAEVLKVQDLKVTPHLTEECKRVLAEHAVRSFGQFFDVLGQHEKGKVLEFVQNQLGSSRRALRVEAEAFLKRWDK
jgi:hypothetical protein